MKRTAAVAGVVLAAGCSTRLAGEVPKQLLELDGEPLVRRVARTALASRLSEVVVVLGHRAEAVGAALAGLAVRRVVNPDFEAGQSTSVRSGLASLGSAVAAAMFLPADQPLLTATTIDRLVTAWEATGGPRRSRGKAGPIVVPVHRSGWRSPVLFDRSLFGELRALRGDAGGRLLLPRHREAIVTVEVADGRELADVDTVDDLRRLMDTGLKKKRQEAAEAL